MPPEIKMVECGDRGQIWVTYAQYRKLCRACGEEMIGGTPILMAVMPHPYDGRTREYVYNLSHFPELVKEAA